MRRRGGRGRSARSWVGVAPWWRRCGRRSLLRDPVDELRSARTRPRRTSVTAHIADDAAAPASIEATERALWHLQAFGLRPVGQLRGPVGETTADWTDGWKARYTPQRIGRRRDRAVLARGALAAWRGRHPAGPGDGVRHGPAPDDARLPAAAPARLDRCRRACSTSAAARGSWPLPPLRLGAGRADASTPIRWRWRRPRRTPRRTALGAGSTREPGTLPATPSRRAVPARPRQPRGGGAGRAGGALAAHTAPGGALLASGIIEGRGAEVQPRCSRRASRSPPSA